MPLLPKRSPYGVGKAIGGHVYLHVQYAAAVIGDRYREAVERVPAGFPAVVVKWSPTTGTLSLIASPDFDAADEPTVGDAWVVRPDGTVKAVPQARDPWIYHHKWLMVADDYAGFDVAASKARSRAWTALLGIDRSRIGKRSYWEREVLPRLGGSPRRYYAGPPLETGGTSIRSAGEGVAPAVRWLFERGHLSGRVLDYGAGAYARNADWLRARGLAVYAYDPHNGTDADGWTGVSTRLPAGTFDVAFTSFVLNVVPEAVESDILRAVAGYAPVRYHITRNADIVESVTKALARPDPVVLGFFREHFGEQTVNPATIRDFCLHGVRTRRGFQRLPELDRKGCDLLLARSGYKLYRQ